jgi:hypothetical protein
VSTGPVSRPCCDHAAEIARLRAEVAELRARIDVLIHDPRPEPDLVRVAPVHDGGSVGGGRSGQPALGVDARRGLPYADRDSTDTAKLALFRALFAGRDDVYAYRWENAATGEKGWAPKRRPGSRKEDGDFLPLADEVVAEHLRDGPQTVGLYVMLPDSMCRLLVCDFDDASWQLDAAAYAQVGEAAGVPVALEVSRSGEGAHAWTFFSEPVAASDARALGAALLREAMAVRGELGLGSYDRLFPSQDFVPKRGFGNLIALPLQGRCRRQTRTTLFVDPGAWEPYPDQFAYLSSIWPDGPA